MKKQITITWNPEKGDETQITYSEAWGKMDRLEQLDNLGDALGELGDKYTAILKKMS